jgi:peptidoglycan/LPS O-acetylase OafA/YrhL
MTAAKMPPVGNSLEARFDPRRNSLNFLRLVLAVSVVISHSWPLDGYGKNPGVGNQLLGDWAVDGFFAISGYLILSSRLNSRSLIDFFWRRVLRIWPAFLVALVLVAFVAAPVSVFVLHDGTYYPLSAVTYVAHNSALVIGQLSIRGTLGGVPGTPNWNAPLWTLAYEFCCYIAIALIATIVPRRFLGIAVLVGLVGATTICCLRVFTHVPVPESVFALARLGSFFTAGSALLMFRARVPMRLWLAILALVISVALVFAQVFNVFGAIPFAYLLMYLGITLPLQAVGARNDFSYGMYIYAYPVQLLIVIALGPRGVPVGVYILLSILLAAPLAIGSWFLVERNAMSLKRLTAKGRSSRTDPAPAVEPAE